MTSGKLIGGYASHSWRSSPSNYFGNSSSFLFSLTNNYKHSHYRYTNYLYSYSSYGPTWGGGHDFMTGSGTFSSGTYCNLGHNYRCRTGSYGSGTCRSDFCGSSPKISDIEVWVRKGS